MNRYEWRGLLIASAVIAAAFVLFGMSGWMGEDAATGTGLIILIGFAAGWIGRSWSGSDADPL